MYELYHNVECTFPQNNLLFYNNQHTLTMHKLKMTFMVQYVSN